jgi:aryl-alcohol dehydrogenase-like predicted oxidoreductase
LLSGRLTSPDDLAADDLRRGLPRFQGEHFARNLAVVAQLTRLARARGATASQLAIAWLLAQGDDVVPIPGAERRRYLEENVRALEVRLTPKDLAAIDKVPRPCGKGGRRVWQRANRDVAAGAGNGVDWAELSAILPFV